MGTRMLGKQNEPSSISQQRAASCSLDGSFLTPSGYSENLQPALKSELRGFVVYKKENGICDVLQPHHSEFNVKIRKKMVFHESVITSTLT